MSNCSILSIVYFVGLAIGVAVSILFINPLLMFIVMGITLMFLTGTLPPMEVWDFQDIDSKKALIFGSMHTLLIACVFIIYLLLNGG